MSKLKFELNNYFSVIGDLASGTETWDSKPAWLAFSPNNLCNLRCVMCGQADGVPLEVMPKDDAVQLLDEVLPWVSLWTPAGLSEPMLANIKLVIQKCREHEVFLNMNTNLTVLNGKRFEEICDRVHKLWISFDSPVREVFESLRVRADFDQVVNNLEEVVAVATEKGTPIGFVAVLMKDNLVQLPDLVDFLADRGAVEAGADLRVQTMLTNSTSCEHLDVHGAFTDAEICEWLDRAVARAEARGLIFHVDMDEPFRRSVAPRAQPVRGILPDVLIHLIENIRERYPHFCYMGATYMQILPNGEVYPCCRGPEELLMGNVNENTAEEIWNSERYREFRRRMQARDYHETCRTCEHLVANPHFDKSSLDQPSAEQQPG